MKRPPYLSILCPTDLASTGDPAVGVAFALAARGGTVHLLHVWEPAYVLSPLDATPVAVLPHTPQSDAAHEAKVRTHLTGLVPAAATAGDVRHEMHVVKDANPIAAILAQAAGVRADVIVMGTHGRTGVRRVLMGSVASDIVKSSPVPVILVRPEHPA